MLQLFEDNFVHADLHAGNILLRDTSGGDSRPQLVLLDAGLTVELGPFDRKNFVSLFRAVIDNDGREVARLMMESRPSRGDRQSGGVRGPIEAKPAVQSLLEQEQSLALEDVKTAVIRPEEYQQEMAKLVSHVHAHGLKLNKISVSDLLRDVLRLSYEHNVKLESRFVTVVLAIMLAEGMGRRLDPEVDIIARATPFIRAATVNMFLGR